MEGQKKKHFPSIQRNLGTGQRQSQVLKSLLKLKDEEAIAINQPIATISDFNSFNSGTLQPTSSELKHRKLRKKTADGQENIDEAGASMGSQPNLSTANIAVHRYAQQQKLDDLILKQEGMRELLALSGITDTGAKAMLSDSIFRGRALKALNNNGGWQAVGRAMQQYVKKENALHTAKINYEDKENRITEMIDTRLRELQNYMKR